MQKKKCVLYQINATEDHIHIATHIHPSISLSSLVKDIKVSSSIFIKEQKLFKKFDGWQKGYGAFTYSVKEKDALVNYIKNQEQHHKTVTFKEEYIKILSEFNVDFDEKYLL